MLFVASQMAMTFGETTKYLRLRHSWSLKGELMSMNWRITFVLILVLCVIISCSKSTKHEDFELSPWAYEEAGLIALCLSWELVAPDSLYNQILSDLVAIRSTFGDNFDAIRITFMPPWIASCLMVGFDDTTAQKVANGEYRAWDELNKKYGVTKINTSAVTRSGYAELYFKGRWHPRRLGEQYAVLSGVTYAGPNHIYGDWPNVYARQTAEGLTYLFRAAWGDCLSGCIFSEYWYFIFEVDQPVFVGHWVPHEDPNEPDWWEEARLNKEHYCD